MPDQPPPARQTAIGKNIAQAWGPHASASVTVYEFAPPAPVDANTLAAARQRLAQMPLDTVPQPAPLPAGSRMPYAANPHFVGRDEELMTLARLLKADQPTVISQVAATGLGGIGKSQLAAAFVHRYGQYFAGGDYWLSLADPAAIPSEVALCGGRGRLNLAPDFEQLDLPTQVRLVLSAWQSDLPRLLVFDNCDGTPDADAEALLARWRPPHGGCRLLITSRRQQWSRTLAVQSLPLPTLPRDKSIELLLNFLREAPLPTSPQRGEEPDSPLPLGREAVSLPEGPGVRALNAIAAELGDLPLALHLAGSFLARYRRSVSPADYLAQLQAINPLEHPALQGRGADYSPTEHDLHVARTFALSYQRLDPADPIDALARQLLARAACFAPGEPIPTALLLATLEVEADEENEAEAEAEEPRSQFTIDNDSPRSVAEWGSQLIIDDALHRLTELGLLEPTGADSVTLHRLLAAFTRQAAPDPAAQPAVEQTILYEARQLNKAGYPAPLLSWQPHLRHITDTALSRAAEQAAGLANELGYHLDMVGEYAGARPYYEEALAIHKKVLGAEHPATALSLNNLGGLLARMGEYAGARPYYEEALAIHKKVLGAEHPDTAMSLNNLGFLLDSMGEYAGARPYYEEALAIRQKVLGAEHPDTALSLNNLGGLLDSMGEYAGARPYYEEALAIHKKVLGAEHPDTAMSLNNLGFLLARMGEYAGARPYFEEALAINKKVLGAEHPATALSLNNLGGLLARMGEYAGARPYYEEALAIHKKVLGAEHPDTARSLNNLGGLLDSMGEYAGARPYYEEALAIRQKVLGAEHPDTALSLNNLGGLLDSMGEYAGARPYYEEALAIRQKVLGAEHPDTALSLNNLGFLLARMGEYAGARPYYEEALAIRQKVLGAEHPDTAQSLNNLASLLQAQGEYAGARPYYEEALAIFEQKLGPDHPHTRIVRGNLQALLDQLKNDK